jgi:hypothetical protein
MLEASSKATRTCGCPSPLNFTTTLALMLDLEQQDLMHVLLGFSPALVQSFLAIFLILLEW